MVSEGLTQFLDWVRETEELYRIGAANEEEANQETQDILHSLELEDHSYNETARLGKKLKEVRQKRRAGKDLMDQTSPVCEWADSHVGRLSRNWSSSWAPSARRNESAKVVSTPHGRR